jgi:hypothetical protein
VTYNEVHDVEGKLYSIGVESNQTRAVYQTTGGTSKKGAATQASIEFAGGNSFIGSNAVWGLRRGSTSATMAGISVTTRRGADMLTPSIPDFFTTGDRVVNNTVVMTNDNMSGTGAIIGVGIQNANGASVMNNAIALLGEANAATMAHSALLYEGTLFRNGKANDWYLPEDAPASLISDNNAYFTPNAGIARFVEISDKSEMVSTGTQNEFLTINQWKTWTKQDINSVVGDFVSEHEFQGVAPNQRLRVKITPRPPIGSILNDRGVRIATLTSDIQGQERGAAGQGYDIGADEFDGRLYVSDLEMVDILTPGAYKSATGVTSEAEYIMTKAPVDVSARVRNSGALPRTNAQVTVSIYRETAASNNGGFTMPTWEGTPQVTKTVTVADLGSGANEDVIFGLENFTPQTYSDLAGYTVPQRFSAMALNVTPRYRVMVDVPSDENNGNNASTKTVRFYVKRSTKDIMVSGTDAAAVINASATSNQLAGRLNADSVMKALKDLGWANDAQTGAYNYDVFDRNAWEGRAVDYTMYRTMFWSDDQNGLSREQRDDLRNYISGGTARLKRNLAISSQELVRAHVGTAIVTDQDFINRELRAQYVAPGTPAQPNYDGKRVVGAAIARNTVETVQSTTVANDAAPMPALMKLFSDNQTSGIALEAYRYHASDKQTIDDVAGVATASLMHNIVYLGVDWRHFQRSAAFKGVEGVMRGVLDFFNENGGSVVPVELVSFDAKARTNDVDVFWATASEQNADHFSVERADATAGQITSQDGGYMSVATVAAAGNTTERRDYSVVDRDLAPGTYLYRLNMVDRDGSQSRTPAVQVVIGGEQTAVTINGVTPNPASTEARVMVTLQEQLI